MSTPDKSICVVDTCSLLYAAQIQLKNVKVFDWLLEKYKVFVCPTVKFECLDNIQRNRVQLEDPARVKSEISNLNFEDDCPQCLEYIDEFCNRKGLTKFFKVDDGERHTFALAMYLSINLKEPLVLMTEDLAALEAFNEILTEQKFGVAKSLPDFIINLFQSTESIDENGTRRAIQSYYNIATKAPLRKRIFDPRMELNCRSFWIENCANSCFS